MTAPRPLRERVTFLDGPYAGQVREVPVGDRLGLNVPNDDTGVRDDRYVTYRLTTWNEVTYGHVAPVRLVGDRRAILAAELTSFPSALGEIYHDLEKQVLEQPGVIASTAIRWKRDDDLGSVLGVEALACP